MKGRGEQALCGRFTDGNLGTEHCQGDTDKGDVAAKAAPEHVASSLLFTETRVSLGTSQDDHISLCIWQYTYKKSTIISNSLGVYS